MNISTSIQKNYEYIIAVVLLVLSIGVNFYTFKTSVFNAKVLSVLSTLLIATLLLAIKLRLSAWVDEYDMYHLMYISFLIFFSVATTGILYIVKPSKSASTEQVSEHNIAKNLSTVVSVILVVFIAYKKFS